MLDRRSDECRAAPPKVIGGAVAASAAPVGPCNIPEGIYAVSGEDYVVKNCRSTTARLQLIIVDRGAVTHREACTSVAPGGTLSILNGVPTLTARWSWTYC